MTLGNSSVKLSHGVLTRKVRFSVSPSSEVERQLLVDNFPRIFSLKSHAKYYRSPARKTGFISKHGISTKFSGIFSRLRHQVHRSPSTPRCDGHCSLPASCGHAGLSFP